MVTIKVETLLVAICIHSHFLKTYIEEQFKIAGSMYTLAFLKTYIEEQFKIAGSWLPT